MARPSLLTDELRVRIEHELGLGGTREVVCQRTGVSRGSLDRWIATGKVVPGRQTPEVPRDPSTLSLSRLQQAEPGLLAAIVSAAQRGQWQAAAWVLERAFPERWSKPDGKLPPAFGAAADAFAEIDELAARRRAR